jgi:hypothetical protein
VSGVPKSFVASGNIGRSKHYRSVMVQYCGGGNIAGASGAGTVAAALRHAVAATPKV